MPKMDRRRRHDFRKFREHLERLSSEEIRERLNTNRIRSTQRRAVAEQLLRERAEKAPAGPAPAAGPARAAGEAASQARAAQRGAEPGRTGAPDGGARAGPRGRGAAAYAARSAGPGAARRAAPSATRRAGRPAMEQACALLGAIVVLASFLAAVTALLRR